MRPAAGRLPGMVVSPVAQPWRVQLHGHVAFEIGGRRQQRRMRGHAADMQEEWRLAIAMVEEFDGLGHAPGRLVVALVVGPGPHPGAIARDAAILVRPDAEDAVVGWTEHIAMDGGIDLGEGVLHEGLEAIAGMLGELVHPPADRDGLVAGVAQHRRQGRGEDALPHRHGIHAGDAGGGRGEAGQQAAPGGYAGRTRRVGAAEADAVLGQTVEDRGHELGMPVDGQAISAELVGHDQQDVGSARALWHGVLFPGGLGRQWPF